MAMLAFATGLVSTPGRVVLNVDVHDLPQYPLMFAAGVLAQRHDWLRRIPSRTAGRGGSAGCWRVRWPGSCSSAWAARWEGQLRVYFGGWHWQAAGMDAWRAGMCVSLTLGLVTLYRDRFDTTGPMARFLTRNAFGVYVFHPPILIAATRILQEWPADAAIKFLVASIIGVTATFIFVGLVARKILGLRAIL